MPSVSQTTISPVSGKKRRRDDDAGGLIKISSPRHALHDTIFNNAANRDDGLQLNTERKQLAPRRRLHEHKRQRIEVTDVPARETHLHEDWQIRRGAGELVGEGGERAMVKPKIDLSPCHVCWRKPTEKSQLDSYADCEGCGKRTCYVCMRECEGLGILQHDVAFSLEFDGPAQGFDFEAEGFGYTAERRDAGIGEGRKGGERVWESKRIDAHRRKICSRCCVERGMDGEVWCLGCLRAEGVS